MKKYRLTEKTIKWVNKTLYRIQALIDIPNSNVKTGNYGGFVESENNLSHEGECWIANNAKVYDNAQVVENAWILGDANIFRDVMVHGNARVFENVKIFDNAQVHGNALVFGNAEVCGDARVYGHAQVYGNALVYGDAQVYGDIKIETGQFSSGNWYESSFSYEKILRYIGCSEETIKRVLNDE